jgi:hypothetical protein
MPATSHPPAPFAITDNSFFIEEAFNQEQGIFQNIFGFTRSPDRTWNASFTQEWPLSSVRHQFSYTLTFLGDSLNSGIGDSLINYRLQIVTEAKRRPAFSPRISIILPTGSAQKGLGDGNVGWQVNLPISKQFRDVYLHGNAGLTYAKVSEQRATTPTLGTSAIWRVKPMVHPLIEALVELNDQNVVTISPGVRGGRNFGDQQVVVGVAAPIERSGAQTNAGIFLYFSYELPFKK